MVTIIPYQQLLTLGWVPDDASGEGEGVQAAHVLVEPGGVGGVQAAAHVIVEPGGHLLMGGQIMPAAPSPWVGS